MSDADQRRLVDLQAGNRARLDQLAAEGVSPNPVWLIMERLRIMEQICLNDEGRLVLELNYEEHLGPYLEQLLTEAHKTHEARLEAERRAALLPPGHHLRGMRG